MRENGLVHIYCGDGKGKTTAAMGLALRSIGHRKPVVIAQFLKDGTSGECRFLGALEHVTVLAANPVGKFSFAMTDTEKDVTKTRSYALSKLRPNLQYVNMHSY